MDDDYVLKYIPVMTDEGKQAHFGEPDYSPDETIQHLTADEVQALEKSDPDFSAYTQLLNDTKLNEKIDSILPPYKRKASYPDFKKRLFYFLSQIKSNVEWRYQIYSPLKAQKFKRDMTRINGALSQITFHRFLKQQYTAAIVEQLQKQNPDMDSFDAFATANAITDFSENLLPLMQKAAGNASKYAEENGEDREKINEQMATIKKDIANVLAHLLKSCLNAPVKNSGNAAGTSKFDLLFITCCSAVGVEDVKPNSDHVQKAVSNINKPLPKHLQRFAPKPNKTK